jgi:hypothetical protein
MPNLKELRAKAKEMGLKQYSKLNKAELLQYITISLIDSFVVDLGGNQVSVEK